MQNQEPDDIPAAKPSPRHWTATFFQGIFIMGIGALYGVFAYRFFSTLFSSPASGKSGLMLMSFVIAVPMCISAIAVYLFKRYKNIGFMSAMGLSGIPVVLFVFIAGALLREGFICIVMALPLFLFVAFIGAIISWIFSRISPSKSDKLLGVMVFMPFVMGVVEQDMTPPDSVQQIRRSVHINAPAAVVWRHINFPTNIQPGELKDGFAYRIGVPFPVEAQTLEPYVGGKRQLIWQKGVSFKEEITDWRENSYIAWKYIFTPDSFPEGSLDDHIVIGGRYFNLEDTAYTLTPENKGTRLDVAVTFRVSTNFNWYAARWARFLVTDTAETILGFYKHRAERT